MKIAILGWGSLIPHPGRLILRNPFVLGGPELPVEFSRRSDRGRLTLVIDRRGDEVPTYFAISGFEDLDQAVEDLRRREGRRVRTEEIGVALSATVVRARDAEAGEVVQQWTATHGVDVTVWTDLASEWDAFSVQAAVEHLHRLSKEDRELARTYFAEAPLQTSTPLRRHLAGWAAGGPLPLRQ